MNQPSGELLQSWWRFVSEWDPGAVVPVKSLELRLSFGFASRDAYLEAAKLVARQEDVEVRDGEGVHGYILSLDQIDYLQDDRLLSSSLVPIFQSGVGTTLLLSFCVQRPFECRWLDSGFFSFRDDPIGPYWSDWVGYPWSVITELTTMTGSHFGEFDMEAYDGVARPWS